MTKRKHIYNNAQIDAAPQLLGENLFVNNTHNGRRAAVFAARTCTIYTHGNVHNARESQGCEDCARPKECDNNQDSRHVYTLCFVFHDTCLMRMNT